MVPIHPLAKASGVLGTRLVNQHQDHYEGSYIPRDYYITNFESKRNGKEEYYIPVKE